jgi:L-fuconate dehydratase
MFDYVAVSGTLEDRVIEYVDHLHEHFIDPVVIRGGRYRTPTMPGFSAEMWPAALEAHLFPGGSAWSD